MSSSDILKAMLNQDLEKEKKRKQDYQATRMTPNEKARRSGAQRDETALNRAGKSLIPAPSKPAAKPASKPAPAKTGNWFTDVQRDIYNSTLKPVQDFTDRVAARIADPFNIGPKVIPQNPNMPSFVKDAFTSPTTTSEKTADIVGNIAGLVAPTGLAYKTGGKLAGKVASNLGNKALPTLKTSMPKVAQALRHTATGAGAGAAYGIANETADSIFDTRNDGSQSLAQRAGNVGLEATLFGSTDGLLNMAGQVLKHTGVADKAGQIASKVIDFFNPKPASSPFEFGTMNQTKSRPMMPGTQSKPMIKNPFNTDAFSASSVTKPRPVYEQPTGVRNFSDKELSFLDMLKQNNTSIHDIERNLQAKADQHLNDELTYLATSQKQGVSQGNLIRDEHGNVVDRTGRISNNPQWYQEFHAHNGRAPSQKELVDLAYKRLREGSSEAPANHEFIKAENALNAVKAIKQKAGIEAPKVNHNDFKIPGDYQITKEKPLSERLSFGQVNTPKLRQLVQESESKRINQEVNKPGEYTVYRRDNAGANLNPESKPHGLYVSWVKDKNTFETPFEHVGNSDFHGKVTPKNPLIAKEVVIQHKRFGTGRSGAVSAGVSALKDLVPEQRFNELIKMNKNQVTDVLKHEFPGHDYTKYGDSYELLEAYGSMLARKKGHDAIVLEDLEDPSFSEIVVLKNDILKLDNKNSVKPEATMPPKVEKPNYIQLREAAMKLKNQNNKVQAPLKSKEIPKPLKDRISFGSLGTPKAREMKPALNDKSHEQVAAANIPEGTQAFFGNANPLRSGNGGKDTITRKEVVDNIQKNFGVKIRTGRLGIGDPAVKGLFKVNPEVVRTRMDKDISVIAHEVGHFLDKKHSFSIPAFDHELIPLGNKTSGKGYTLDQIRKEGVAEFIRMYLTDTQKAIQQAPQFAKVFTSRLDNKTLKALQATQKDIDTWINQGEAMQFRGQINRTGREPLKKTAGEKIDKIYTNLVDKFNPLAAVEKTLNGGKLKDASESLYKKARLSVGSTKYAAQVLQDLKTALKPLDDLGFTVEDLGDYATAKHALELEAQGIQSGFTSQQIQAVLQKFGTPEMDAIQKELVSYSDRLLNILVDAQVLSQDAVNAMRTKYKDYVPFYRFFDEDMTGSLTGGGKGFADLTNPVKRIKGSSRDVIDPIESIIKNTFAAVNAAEKNKVGLELAKLADVDGAGAFIERLSGAQKSAKENIVTVFRNGERVQYQLEPELYRAILQLDKESTNTLVKILSYPASMLRGGATLTPEFMLRNPIRDQFQTWVVSNYGYNPIIDLPKGLWHMFNRKTGVYEDWVKQGGGYGQYVSQDRNHLREEMTKLLKQKGVVKEAVHTVVSPKRWLQILQRFSEMSEEATKVGEFNRGIKKKGATPQEAAFQSRDLMDFGRVGTDIQQINKVVAFFNANVQGKDRIARAFKNNPVRTTVRAVTGITLPTIGLYMLNNGDFPAIYTPSEKAKEIYDNIPQWQKDTFFIVPILGTEEFARLPKPFDLAPIFSSIPEQMMRQMRNDDPQAYDEFAKNLAGQFSIPYMLTGLTPVLENITNYSFFTGGPIVPMRDQNLEPKDQYGVNTSLTARSIGKALNYSPYKVDNLIRGYGAGLGKYATQATDKGVIEPLGLGKLPPAEEKKWSELPVVNAFTVDTTGGGQIMTDFYKQLKKNEEKIQSAKKNDERPKNTSAYKKLQRANKRISDLRAKYRDAQGSYKLSSEQKRATLDRLDEQMNNVARQAVQSSK